MYGKQIYCDTWQLIVNKKKQKNTKCIIKHIYYIQRPSY